MTLNFNDEYVADTALFGGYVTCDCGERWQVPAPSGKPSDLLGTGQATEAALAQPCPHCHKATVRLDADAALDFLREVEATR